MLFRWSEQPPPKWVLKKFINVFDDVNNRRTLKLYKFIYIFLLTFCGSHDLLFSPSAIVFQTKMARTGQKRDIPVQKASAGASVPPEKKYKNAILAEIVREIENATLKASNSHGIEQCIIEQHKKDFPWLNKNNVDYFRRANLPANSIIIVKQPTVISDLLGTRNKVSKDMSSSINSNALLDTNTNPSQNDVSSLIMSSKDLDPSSSTKRASNPTKKHIQVDWNQIKHICCSWREHASCCCFACFEESKGDWIALLACRTKLYFHFILKRT